MQPTSTSSLVGNCLGPWSQDPKMLQTLRAQFVEAAPFSHVKIDNFFTEEFAQNARHHFPTPGPDQSTWRQQGFCVYDNPVEGKLAVDKKGLDSLRGESGDQMRKIFEIFQSEPFVELMRTITGMPELEKDDHLHGAGLHYHPPGGRLAMHLDYSIHPITGKERRVNLIVYLNPEWRDEWNGALELWSSGMRTCEKRYLPGWNTAVLFQTFDESYHGLPDVLACPEGDGRCSVAVYYVSDPRPGVVHRPKAMYVARPTDPHDEGMEALMRIRAVRRLTDADLAEHAPKWRARWPNVPPEEEMPAATATTTTTTTTKTT